MKQDSVMEKLKWMKVEWKPLKNILGFISTGKLNANAMEDNGAYPFFTCNEEPYRINNYAFDMEAILISGNGSQVGHVNYYNGKFNAYQRTYVLGELHNSILFPYLYHYFKFCLREYIIKNSKKGSIPYITLPMLENFQVPIPPLETQKEIVKILDKLTELEATLEAELSLRVKQYAYYRDLLLTPNIDNPYYKNNVLYKTLDEITQITNNIKWRDTDKSYRYIDLSSVSRENHSIGETLDITAMNAPSRAQKLVSKDDVIFATTRPTQLRFALIDENFDGEVASTGYCILRAKTDEVLPKWIYHHLGTPNFKDFLEENQSGSAYPSVSDSKVKEFKIPVPSLDIQKKIILILDIFETHTHSIKEGLPYEIELRKKQYEYYRKLLLSFNHEK